MKRLTIFEVDTQFKTKQISVPFDDTVDRLYWCRRGTFRLVPMECQTPPSFDLQLRKTGGAPVGSSSPQFFSRAGERRCSFDAIKIPRKV